MISSLIFLLLLAIGVPKIVEYTIVLYRSSTSKELAKSLDEVPLLEEAPVKEVELGPYRKAWIPEDTSKDDSWDEPKVIVRPPNRRGTSKTKHPPGTVIKVPIHQWALERRDFLDTIESQLNQAMSLKIREIWDEALSKAIRGNVELINIKDLKEKEIKELVELVDNIGFDVIREGHNSITISIGRENLESRNIMDIQRGKIYRNRYEASSSFQG